MADVMIDLETLGARPGSTILSLAAVEFDANGAHRSYYGYALRASCRKAGLEEDADTIAWWSRQSDEARKTLDIADSSFAMTIGDLLAGLAYWLKGLDDVFVWGTDLPILSEAYHRCGMNVPWKPYSGRCYRTLKNLRPDVALTAPGTKHNALDDATSQAVHAGRILVALGVWRAAYTQPSGDAG